MLPKKALRFCRRWPSLHLSAALSIQRFISASYAAMLRHQAGSIIAISMSIC